MTTLKRYNGTDWEYIGLPTNPAVSPQTLGYAEYVGGLLSLPGVAGGDDIPGLSVTVTVPEGRRIKITAAPHARSTVSTDQVYIRILEDGVLKNFSYGNETGPGGAASHVEQVLTPTAGTHTYKIRAVRASGSGTIQVYGVAGEPGWLLVEDITGSTLPYQPASVPVGQLGFAQVASLSQTTTSEADIAGLSVNIVVPAGRVLKITGKCHLANNLAAGDQNYLGITEAGANLNRSYTDFSNNGLGVDVIVKAIVSPSAGAHTYQLVFGRGAGDGTLTAFASTSTLGFLLVEDITPTPAPSSGAPGSTLGYAPQTSNLTGFSADTDVPGATTTITVPAGRRLKITGRVAIVSPSVANAEYVVWIKEDGINKQHTVQRNINIGDAMNLHVEFVTMPSAGVHTYKLAVQRTAGTGTANTSIAGDRQGYILVEDITGSVWPEGSTVTAGMIVSEPWTSWSPVITQGNTPTATVNWARYHRIGRLITAHFHVSLTSAGTTTQNIEISLPVPAVSNLCIGGSFRYFDAGNTIRAGTIIGSTVSIARFVYDGYGNNMGFGDFVIANGDLISGTLIYEAAN